MYLALKLSPNLRKLNITVQLNAISKCINQALVRIRGTFSIFINIRQSFSIFKCVHLQNFSFQMYLSVHQYELIVSSAFRKKIFVCLYLLRGSPSDVPGCSGVSTVSSMYAVCSVPLKQ